MLSKTVLFISLLLFAGPVTFPDTSYNQYSWKEFYKLANANQPIDFAHPDMELLDACIFYASNEQRELQSRSQFAYGTNLRTAADFHSQQMIIKNFFNHVNPYNAAYSTPDKRMVKFNCKYYKYGENIAYFSTKSITYLDAGKKLLDQWMHSPEHRRNLLDKDFTFLGAGAGIKPWKKQNGIQFYLIYGTQDFGGKPY